jgi:hypothetical protein
VAETTAKDGPVCLPSNLNIGSIMLPLVGGLDQEKRPYRIAIIVRQEFTVDDFVSVGGVEVQPASFTLLVHSRIFRWQWALNG